MGFSYVLLGQAEGQFQAAAVAAPGGDFRPYVFAAYGAAILLLFLFSIYTVSQLWATERKVRELGERIERAPGEVSPRR